MDHHRHVSLSAKPTINLFSTSLGCILLIGEHCKSNLGGVRHRKCTAYSTFQTSGHWKRFTILPNIHPLMHASTHRRQCQPCKATASSSGAVRVRCAAQRHLDTARMRQGSNKQPFDYQPTHSTSFATCRPCPSLLLSHAHWCRCSHYRSTGTCGFLDSIGE